MHLTKHFVSYFLILATSLVASSCDQTKDQSASPKTRASEEPKDVEADENTEVEEGASFTVLVPAGAAGMARLGKNRVLVDENSSSVPIRVTLKRASAKDVPSEDSVIIGGTEMIKVEVTNGESGEFIGVNELNRPLRIQTILRSSAQPEDYYVALWLHAQDGSNKLRSRTAIAGEALQNVSQDPTLNLMAANQREFSAKDPNFTFAVVYQSKIDSRFQSTGSAAGSSTGSDSSNENPVVAGSGVLSLDENFGSGGVSTVANLNLKVNDAISYGNETKYVCGSIADAGAKESFYLGKLLLSSSAARLDGNFGNGGQLTLSDGTNNTYCVRLLASPNSQKILAVYIRADASNLNPQWSLIEIDLVNPSSQPTTIIAPQDLSTTTTFHEIMSTTSGAFFALYSSSGTDTGLKHFASNGALVSGFGANGTVILTQESCQRMHLDELRGKLTLSCVTAGTSMSRPIRLRQFTLSGNVDATWNQQGISTEVALARNSAVIVGLHKDAKDNFYSVGSSDGGNAGELHWNVTKFKSNGTLDMIFGNSGTVLSSSPSIRMNDSLFDPDASMIYMCGGTIGSTDARTTIAQLNLTSATSSSVATSATTPMKREAAWCTFDGSGILSVLYGFNRLDFVRVNR